MKANKEAVHYTADYIINPAHPVTVNVIGCGGTGSQVLNSLARMHSALKALGHPGLYVRAVDPDRVTVANMGRQLFSPADVGAFKCVVLIGRINRYFGTDWEAAPELYQPNTSVPRANITISCVDTGLARYMIKQVIFAKPAVRNTYRHAIDYDNNPYHKPYYWMDFGNMNDRGQVVIGTVGTVKQPKSEFKTVGALSTIDSLHPEILKDRKGEDQGPSCSLAEALQKQDLFINTNLANTGLAILWKMFRELKITYHGAYVNLDSMIVNPIKIQA